MSGSFPFQNNDYIVLAFTTMSSPKESILLLGAGKSSAYVVWYLAAWCHENQVDFIIADLSLLALDRVTAITTFPCQTVLLKEEDTSILEHLVASSSIVISMLPVAFHERVARLCLAYSKHLLTASYISSAVKMLEDQVKKQALTFLFECGLDPGIDHMSAFALLNGIRCREEHVVSFISSTGGLVDPSCEGINPWHYKFTWNPRNVVLAGQGTAIFKEDGTMKQISYEHLFQSARSLPWNGNVKLEFYPNRDSVQYQTLYGLQDADTFIRGTIRRQGYSEAWHVLVSLGMTNDAIELPLTIRTHRDFLNHFIPCDLYTPKNLEEYLGFSIPPPVWEKLSYLDLDSLTPFSTSYRTAAAYLQAILEVKWKLEEEDKDWVLMQHRIVTQKGEVRKEYTSTLSVIGENQTYTAMAKTVGLPLAMAAVLVLTKQWCKPGIHIPSDPSLYELLLPQLEQEGIRFIEEEHQR